MNWSPFQKSSHFRDFIPFQGLQIPTLYLFSFSFYMDPSELFIYIMLTRCLFLPPSVFITLMSLLSKLIPFRAFSGYFCSFPPHFHLIHPFSSSFCLRFPITYKPWVYFGGFIYFCMSSCLSVFRWVISAAGVDQSAETWRGDSTAACLLTESCSLKVKGCQGWSGAVISGVHATCHHSQWHEWKEIENVSLHAVVQFPYSI